MEMTLEELRSRLAEVREERAKLKTVCKTWFKLSSIERNLLKRIRRLESEK